MKQVLNIKQSDTEKRHAILQTLAAIPYGSVTSYGEVAERAGFKGYARYVAYVMRNLPEGSEIPWHRVVTSQGKIAFAADNPLYQRQVALLQQEGIACANGRVAFHTRRDIR